MDEVIAGLFSQILNLIRAINVDVAELMAERRELQQDVSELKAEVHILKYEMKRLKGESNDESNDSHIQ